MQQMQIDHFRDNGGGHHPLMWLFVIAVIAIVALIVYYAVRYANRPLAHAAAVVGAPAGNVLGIVALRYANGEIGRDEYLRMTADLGGAPVPVTADEPPPAVA